MVFDKLYKKNKNGSFQEWLIYTDGADIITEHGKTDGKKQQSVKTVKGKNVGRANETTAEQQAVSTAQSMWTKKKDKGYFLTLKEAEEEVVFLPMLACDMLKLSDKRKEEILESTFAVQPKLDGVRCLARWNGDSIQLLSRGGKEYNLPHIAKALESIIRPGQVLDGEVYIHGALRQDINALVKKWRDEEYENTGYSSADLQYWVYDTFEVDNLERSFKERIRDVSSISCYGDVVKSVFTFYIAGQALEEFHTDFTADGFEGTIIRMPSGGYELGHRSRDLIKYKDFQDAEYKIVGFKDGEGKFEGCVIWQCDNGKGSTFDVVPKGSIEQKKKLFSIAEDYVGKMLTVKFQSLSKDGIPEFPVGLGVRLEEDM